jgi:hypothetical protein
MAKVSQNNALERKPVGKPFVKGVSGNPGGRPAWYKEMRDLFASHSPAAVATLVELMQHSAKDEVRKSAAEGLLDRAGLKAYCVEPENINLHSDGSLADVILDRLTAIRLARRAGTASEEPKPRSTARAKR